MATVALWFWRKEKLSLKDKLKFPLPRQNTERVERNSKSIHFLKYEISTNMF